MVLGEESSREVFLACVAALRVAHRTVTFTCIGQSRILDSLDGLEGVVLEIEQPHPRPSEQDVHAPLSDQRDQRPAKHQPVKSGKHSSDLRLKTRCESIHGILLGKMVA
jgi:hypothetical protein